MTSFVKGNCFLFVWCDNFILFLEPANNTVYSVKEILFSNGFIAFTSGNKRSFITNIRDIGSGKSRGLFC
jgi:hypothetical protein